MTHYPHIHMIVPGGGISLDGERWVSSRARFLLPVRVLAKLFRRLFLDNLQQLHASCLPSSPGAAAQEALGRVLQATALRVGSGARLFVAIHPPRRARYQRRILHRDRRVVTRHDEPQPAVEAMRLRPVGRHVPASVTRPTTTMSPAKSPCLPPSQHLHDAPTQLTCHQLSQVNPIPQSPHHLYSRSRILKSP
jgi:Putative transposase